MKIRNKFLLVISISILLSASLALVFFHNRKNGLGQRRANPTDCTEVLTSTCAEDQEVFEDNVAIITSSDLSASEECAEIIADACYRYYCRGKLTSAKIKQVSLYSPGERIILVTMEDETHLFLEIPGYTTKWAYMTSAWKEAMGTSLGDELLYGEYDDLR